MLLREGGDAAIASRLMVYSNNVMLNVLKHLFADGFFAVARNDNMGAGNKVASTELMQHPAILNKNCCK